MPGDAKAGMTPEADWARYYIRPRVYGLEFLHARFITHAFPWHLHEYFAIGVIETGTQTFSDRRGKHATPTGGIFVVPPDEPHTGEPATAAGFTYRTFYPPADLLAHAAAEASGRRQSVPYFPHSVIVDAALSRQFVQLHRALIAPTSTTEGETRVLEVFTALIARHARHRPPPQRLGQERDAVRRVREYIDAHADTDLSLADLAAQVALSPFYLARVFKAELGLPPHAYLESVRIRRAQALIDRGMPLAAVASTTGFADQSHLTHRFKRAIGVTPGAFARRKILQDSAR